MRKDRLSRKKRGMRQCHIDDPVDYRQLAPSWVALVGEWVVVSRLPRSAVYPEASDDERFTITWLIVVYIAQVSRNSSTRAQFHPDCS
ncbi:hypothetical protein BDW62DRAFT_181970 [Aspergillus aurantiobrunneus]